MDFFQGYLFNMLFDVCLTILVFNKYGIYSR